MDIRQQSGPEESARAVLEHEQRRLSALRNNNADALDDLLADELCYVYSSGEVSGKQQIVSAIRSGSVRYGEDVDLSELDIRAYEDNAVLLGVFHVHIKKPDGDLRGLNRFTMNWTRYHDGGWRLASWQSTGLSKG